MQYLTLKKTKCIDSVDFSGLYLCRNREKFGFLVMKVYKKLCGLPVDHLSHWVHLRGNNRGHRIGHHRIHRTGHNQKTINDNQPQLTPT